MSKFFAVTRAFDLYWAFAVERQQIFLERLSGRAMPWTTDNVLGAYKFTNVYRVLDRVSQYLLRNVIYEQVFCMGRDDLFFRIILFKMFNKIETWERVCREFGGVSISTFDFHACDALLSETLRRGGKIFSAAYIMPSGVRNPGYPRKHQNCLAVIRKMLDDKLPDRIAAAQSMQEVYEALLQYPMIGSFLAYQYCIDINYSPLTNFDENEFVVAGPGAKRGIAKCVANKKGLTEAQIIAWMVENQDAEFERLGLQFDGLWGRKLHLIDCQNLFCEVDKYLRVRMPELSISGKTSRIKQTFRPNPEPIDYMLPPKWNITPPRV